MTPFPCYQALFGSGVLLRTHSAAGAQSLPTVTTLCCTHSLAWRGTSSTVILLAAVLPPHLI